MSLRNIFIFIFVFLIIAILVLTVFIFQRRQAQIEDPQTTSVDQTIVGVLRFSGLRDEEKSSLGLSSSTYQVTDLTGDEILKLPTRMSGLFLESSENYEKFLGKCVEVKAVPLKDWNPQNSQVNGQYTYDRFPYVANKIREIEPESCNPYSGTIAQGVDSLSLTGKIDDFKRPAPDIGYDYILTTEQPFINRFNASGSPQEQSSIAVIPSNNEIWKKIEDNQDKTFRVSGSVIWGYAESQYLQIQEIEVLKQ